MLFAKSVELLGGGLFRCDRFITKLAKLIEGGVFRRSGADRLRRVVQLLFNLFERGGGGLPLAVGLRGLLALLVGEPKRGQRLGEERLCFLRGRIRLRDRVVCIEERLDLFRRDGLGDLGRHRRTHEFGLILVRRRGLVLRRGRILSGLRDDSKQQYEQRDTKRDVAESARAVNPPSWRRAARVHGRKNSRHAKGRRGG